MTHARASILATFATIVMAPCLAQEMAVTEDKDKAASKPTEYSDAEYRISSTLGDETIIEASGTPLSALLLELSRMHDIKITVDKQAFRDLELSPDLPITMSANRVPLGVAIEQLADKLELSYMVDDDALLLTSKKVAAEKRSIRLFMLPKAWSGQADRFIRTLTRVVKPGVWKSRGGKCEVEMTGDKIRVVGNDPLFQEVQLFLDRPSPQAASKAKVNPE